MIKRKTGFCIKCTEELENLGLEPKEKLLFRSSPKLCLYHNNKYKQSKAKKPKQKPRKKTGELEMFKEIWSERPHISFVSGDKLQDELDVWNMAHVLSKGAYPRFRLRKDNIVLLTREEHTLYDHASHKIKDDPKWQPLLELKEKLIIEYNSHRRVNKF